MIFLLCWPRCFILSTPQTRTASNDRDKNTKWANKPKQWKQQIRSIIHRIPMFFLNKKRRYIRWFFVYVVSRGRGMWKELPPSGTGPFFGGTVGGSQARYPAPWNLVFPHHRGWGKRVGGRLKNKGWDPLLTWRGGGLGRLPTAVGSH